MHTIISVSTTFAEKEDAERIARLLLDRNLIACAHIAGPVTSVYRWRGKVNSAPEYTMTVKTTRHLLQELQEILIREHPYELPEITGQEIDYVSSAYGDWVTGEVK
jgi:periplasmic divalent cation tolerance protein